MSTAIYETIKASHDLPSPTGVALEILRLARDERSTVRDIARVIEADPALSARLLKLVNGTFAGQQRQVVSIQRAVGLLGTRTITGLALSFSLISRNLEGPCPGFDYAAFWAESLARGVAARHFAKLAKSFSPDEAFTCGLLSQIGRLALSVAFPDAYAAAVKNLDPDDRSAIAVVERRVFGIDHNSLAAEMMGDWQIPNVFRSAVDMQEAPNKETEPTRVGEFARILHLCGHVANVLMCDKVSDETLAALTTEAGDLGFDLSTHHDQIDAMAREWREVGAVISIPTRDVPPVAEIYAQAEELRSLAGAKSYLGRLGSETVTEVCETERVQVLIVDDDEAELILLEKFLSVAGYPVVKARDGEEAMRVLLSEGPPVVITDWAMPKMDGVALCRAIRAHPGIAFAYVIVTTARDADEDRIVEALDAGADNFLSKPYRRKELLARLRAAERIACLQLDLEAGRRAVHRYNAEMEIANAKLCRANEELARMATTDELTGLVNRREALTRLSQHWASSERNNAPLSIITLDFDRFKSCNDTYGHAVGDIVLKEIAAILCESVRQEDTVCRVGGEEFLVLCPHLSEEEASVCAERIRRAVETHVIRHDALALRVTVSLGVVGRTPQFDSSDALLRAADDAMYAAKHAGRNSVRTGFLPPTGEIAIEESPVDPVLRWSAEALNSAVKAEEFATILVGDDDVVALRSFRGYLESFGYQVLEAEKGSDVLRIVNESQPDVVIVGASLSDMTGAFCARVVKANPATQHIPVILASCRSDATSLTFRSDEAFDEYLAKPVNPQELRLRVKTVVRLGREVKRSNEVRGEQSRALNLIQEYSVAVSAADSLDDVLAETVQAAARMLGSHHVSILLPNATGTRLSVAQCLENEDSDVWNICVPVGEATSGRVFSTRERLVINTSDEAEQRGCSCGPDAALLCGVPSVSVALCVPERVVGVLNVNGLSDGERFPEAELEYFGLICNMAASAIHERLTRCARDEARHSIVVALAKLAESRDEGTGKHLERVTQFSGLIADALRSGSGFVDQIDDAFLDNLKQGVPLHDIGKVAVPDRILLKPGRLTVDEMTIMKTHATIGAKTIESVMEQMPGTTFLTMAEEIAHAHHERFDGTGYPRGLSGSEIPLAARIVAVADLYDAITSERPYKLAMSHGKAVSIINEARGAHFDPIVVDAFRSCEGQFKCLAAELADRALPVQPPVQLV